MKYDKMQLKFSDFYLFNKEIRIKFPTYEIRIGNNEMSHDNS